MKEVSAFNCEYCEKLYTTPSRCKSHEYRCYSNPKTKSCASCAFLRYETKTYKPGHIISYQSCLVNIPIGTEGLKTRCEKYLNAQYQEDSEIMDFINSEYEVEKQLFAAISTFKNNWKNQGGG